MMTTKTDESRWPALCAKLQAHSATLAKQGTVTSRIAGGRRVFSVRFVDRQHGGKAVQRCIYVGGDQELVRLTRELLESFKMERRLMRKVARYAEFASMLSGSLHAAHRRRRKTFAFGPHPPQNAWSKESLVL
jgi:hypothetical protein